MLDSAERHGELHCRAIWCQCPEHNGGTAHRQCVGCAQLYVVLWKRSRRVHTHTEEAARASLLKANQKMDELIEQLQLARLSARGNLDESTWQVISDLIAGLRKEGDTSKEFRSGIMWSLIRNTSAILASALRALPLCTLHFPHFSLSMRHFYSFHPLRADPDMRAHIWHRPENFGLLRWLIDGKFSFGAGLIEWLRGDPGLGQGDRGKLLLNWRCTNVPIPSLSTIMKCQPPASHVNGPLPEQCEAFASEMRFRHISMCAFVPYDGVTLKRCLEADAGTGWTYGAVGGPVHDKFVEMADLGKTNLAKEVLIFAATSLDGAIKSIVAVYFIGGMKAPAIIKCIKEVHAALRAAGVNAMYFPSDSPRNQLLANQTLFLEWQKNHDNPFGGPDGTHLFRNMMLPLRKTSANSFLAHGCSTPISLRCVVMLKALGRLPQIRIKIECFPKDTMNTQDAERLCAIADDLLAVRQSIDVEAEAKGLDPAVHLQLECLALGHFLKQLMRFRNAMDIKLNKANDAGRPWMCVSCRFIIVEEVLAWYATVRVFSSLVNHFPLLHVFVRRFSSCAFFFSFFS